MQITELAAKIQPLGLSDKEAKVYVAALFLGPSSVQKIAEQADVNRATAYVILDQLAEMGLVSQTTEGKKTVFVAEGPEMLERLFDRQAELIDERRKELATLLPELQQSHRIEDGAAPVVRFYKGQSGLEAINLELNRRTFPKSTNYSLINYDEVEKIAPQILKKSPKARLKKKISTKIIYSYRKEVPSDPKALKQTMRIDEAVKADVTLRDDIAVFSTYTKNPIGVMVESKEIVGVLRQLFELAWKNREK